MLVQKHDVHFKVTGERRDFWLSLIRGQWEQATFDVFDRHIDRNTTVLDIGAWIGATALYAAHRGKVVHAFEPDPVAFAELSRNLRANPTITNVQLFNACVSVDAGRVRLGVRGTAGNSMSSLLCSDSVIGSWDVASIRLDEFIRQNDISDPIFIKMDIEGHEYDLMPVIANTLKARHAVLYLSTHPQIVARRRAGENVVAKVVGRFRMLMANARLAWALRRSTATFDSYGRRINLWARVPRALLGRSFTSDKSVVAIN